MVVCVGGACVRGWRVCGRRGGVAWRGVAWRGGAACVWIVVGGVAWSGVCGGRCVGVACPLHVEARGFFVRRLSFTGKGASGSHDPSFHSDCFLPERPEARRRHP